MIAACRQSAHLETDVVFADAVGKCIKDVMVHDEGNLIVPAGDVHMDVSYGTVGLHVFQHAPGCAVFAQLYAQRCRPAVVFRIEVGTCLRWREARLQAEFSTS